MAYHSSYTGPQIDQAVGNALNKDTSTLSNDVNHIPASSVVKSALNTVDESIAIRVSGNKTTYASGAAIGQYVIVDGSSIAGITDGLYKATKAIPYNTVIDSTYLTAVSGGGLNDLKAALDAKSDDTTATISTVQNGAKISSSSISYKQFGRMAQFSGYFTINAALAVGDYLFSGVKIASVQYFYFPCFCDGQSKYITLRTDYSGHIVIDSLNGFTTNANETYVVTATYLVNS